MMQRLASTLCSATSCDPDIFGQFRPCLAGPSGQSAAIRWDFLAGALHGAAFRVIAILPLPLWKTAGVRGKCSCIIRRDPAMIEARRLTPPRAPPTRGGEIEPARD